ncbi:DUF4269 domain-containing protein [Niallia circulans]|jgi:hypothetical protein|uniref:Alpha/beta hydrolase n=1 Tax=Niallia circulans TaxID=1397 RepID=A0A0J1IMA3_NIACI|nr:DUF4269 domain-containing protein [Niallia circulans]KLV27102.1 alpha/beta hydrolase [Niallia circulans]MED5101454.1 DUF4269 domain-containing protein [Niallia circulans]PAD86393.1 DUF4269 domain-containing protein [Niallia circulans]
MDWILFDTPDYLQGGSAKQQQAYLALKKLKINEILHSYKPILCGTIPIGVDIESSDLDIIMEVYEFEIFSQIVIDYFGKMNHFRLKRLMIREVEVIKANFYFDGFEFELFGQPIPVKQQYAYLHMIIEHAVLRINPSVKEEVLIRKKQGYKTEPAFCQVLGLKGDPYQALIEYGKAKRFI